MKFKLDETDKKKIYINLIIIFSSIIFFFFMYRFQGFKNILGDFIGVFTIMIIGMVFAFLLGMPVTFMERKSDKIKFFEDMNHKLRRIIFMLLTYILFGLFITLFFSLLIPQLYNIVRSLSSMVAQIKFDRYYTIIKELLDNLNVDGRIIEFLIDKIKFAITYISRAIPAFIPRIGNVATGVVSLTVRGFIGFIFSIYLLMDRERYGALTRKVVYSFLPTNIAENTVRVTYKVLTSLKDYIGAQLTIISILGILVAISLTILGVDGAIAMGFIIAITDLVPYIGPWIGAVPVTLMIAVQDFNKALIFIVIILVLQQIESNILSPKIQGDKMEISAIWILVAITVGGNLFGIMGMILGIPMFVVIYELVKEISEYRLEKKGLPIETEEFMKPENRIISLKKKKVDDKKILNLNKDSDDD